MASGNFIFDAVSPPKRARCVAYLSLNNIGIFLGATFGGWISAYLSNQLIILGWDFEIFIGIDKDEDKAK